MATRIKGVADGLPNSAGTKARNGDGFVSMTSVPRDVPVDLKRHQRFTLGHVIGGLVQQGKVMIPARFGYRLQSNFRPRQVVFGTLGVTLLKTSEATLHPKAAFESQVTRFWRAYNGKGIFDGFIQMCIAEPTATDQTQNGSFASSKMNIHRIKEFRGIHEQRRFGEGQPG
jgi:hypothetical protein